jgi:site-specific DNA recombinase
MNEQPKRAVLYLRVSSAGQVRTDYDPEGLSIPAQRQACERKAEGLDAQVVREYVEPGVSAGPLVKRNAFRKMIEDVRELQDVDYVVVWSVSRWARDQEDHWTARGLVTRAGAKLISVKEPIGEDSAYGITLEGVMAAVAAGRRIEISEEVTRGIRRKIEVGGTHSRAPIGYLNVREPLPQGGEVRTVIIDSERGPIIVWAFETYATGMYSISDMTTLLEVRGLRSRPTSRYSSRPLSQSSVNKMLSNPYYTGKVNHRGKFYPGRHQPLISQDLFDRVQAVLEAHTHSGDRDRKHHHYLKGTIFCGECGRRLTYSRSKGRGGTYEYFICPVNQFRRCPQTVQRVEAVEAAVEQHYKSIAITPADRDRVRHAIKKHLAEMAEGSTEELARCNSLLAGLKKEERKLMEKNYRDEITDELFSEEAARMKRERADAQAVIARLTIRHDDLQKALDLAMKIVAWDIHDLYLRANNTQRRFINQAIFKSIWVSHEDVERSDLNPPYDEISIVSEATRIINDAAQKHRRRRQTATTAPNNGKAPAPKKAADALAQGLIRTSLVGTAGFEPATSRV